MPIVDSFLGHDEIDLAAFRINYLINSVDVSVIGESSLTFTGKRKPLHFRNWLATHPELQSRVFIIELNPKGSDAWDLELDSRKQLVQKTLEMFPGYGYIFSDLDEIPSRTQVKAMKALRGDFHFSTPTSYRKANWLTQDWNARWNRGVFTSRQDFDLPNAGRLVKLPRVESTDLGSHLSYLGFDAAKMRTKLESYSHRELNLAELSSEKLLQFCDDYLIDHLGRLDSASFGLLRSVPRSELTELQLELFRIWPQWFNFSDSNKNQVSRIRASALITMISGKYTSSKLSFKYICQMKLSVWQRLLLELQCGRMILRSALKFFLRRFFAS